LKRILHLSTTSDSLVLDFFSGSSTTAHAVIKLNAEDGGDRRFIMIQLPESTEEGSAAHNAGFQTIAEIGKERIRRAGQKVRKESGLNGQFLDTGFRVLKVDSSNMKEVYYTPDQQEQGDLLGQVGNVKEDRTGEDLLFQVLLDWGVDLTLPITRETLSSKTVFFVDENTLAACFDTGVTEDFVKELADRNPLRVVFRDAGFASDAVKINVDQIFKQISPSTEVKTI
jgi:adenine-specific DNA-methyltransferase